MRAALRFGALCTSQGACRSPFILNSSTQTYVSYHTAARTAFHSIARKGRLQGTRTWTWTWRGGNGGGGRGGGKRGYTQWTFRTPNFGGRKILWSSIAGTSAAGAGAALTPLGLIALGHSDDNNTNGEDITHEEAMLRASRAELKSQVPKALQGSKKVRRGIYFFVEEYIVEPIATGLRFLWLVLLFGPVIVSVPVIWLGRRVEERDGERVGALWWYGFLVRSMERAGAAFIKVCCCSAELEERE